MRSCRQAWPDGSPRVVALRNMYTIIDLGGASDDQIEAKARETKGVIWSKDADFADRARRSPGLQVVWLRLGNTTNTALQAKLARHLPAIEAALRDGESLIEIR